MKTGVAERTNEQWVEALKSGADSTTLEELRAYLRGGLAKTLSRNAAVNESDLDDFTQDAALRVIEKLHTFRGDSRFTTWAMAVAVRVAYTALRKRRWNEVSIDSLELESPLAAKADNSSPARKAENRDIIDALRHAIDHDLTERQRTVVLAELSGMPSAELSRQLNSNSNALYKVYHAARKKLRTSLEEAGFSSVEIRPTQPHAPSERLPELDVASYQGATRDLADRVNRIRDRLDELIHGHRDYAALARR